MKKLTSVWGKPETAPHVSGDTQKIDSEYVWERTCSILFLQSHYAVGTIAISERHGQHLMGQKKKYLLIECYPDYQKIILVMDNLNTHKPASLYKKYPPEKARRIIKKLEIHYTPRHGSWLDIAEIELNVMTRQCLSRRIESIDILRDELAAWEIERNNRQATVNWQFRTRDARIKLVSLYPNLLVWGKDLSLIINVSMH